MQKTQGDSPKQTNKQMFKRKYKYKKLGAWGPKCQDQGTWSLTKSPLNLEDHVITVLYTQPTVSAKRWVQVSPGALAHTPFVHTFPVPSSSYPPGCHAANTKEKGVHTCLGGGGGLKHALNCTLHHSPHFHGRREKTCDKNLHCSFWVIFTALLYSQKWEGCL